MRKLLPYELAIARELGLTPEEYYDFVCAQVEYNDIKKGTVFDIRNEPVSIIFAVVGVIFQVAGALLAPKPKNQESKAQTPTTREQVFAPRFGFNGSQELAKYGEPVNLVYTNIDQNPRGGVRVKTSLVFAAVVNFGSHQMMDVMGVIGSSPVDIDISRTAIGQLPIRRLGGSEIWAYVGNGGAARVSDLRFGRANADPLSKNLPGYAPASRIHRYDGDFNGFSQTFTPSTNNTCGVVGVVPLGLETMVLDNTGDRKFISMPMEMYVGRNEFWVNGRPTVPEGYVISIGINQLSTNITPDFFLRAYNDAITAAFSVLDASATYKIGSAVFDVEYITPGYVTDTSATIALRCIRSGRFPQCPYELQHWLDSPAVGLSLIEGIRRLFTKCLARIERIQYTSVTKCNLIELSLKCQAWRRVSGRASVYGKDQNDFGDKQSDNGLKPRTSMFRVFYSLDNGPQVWIPYIFCVRGITEQEMYNFVKLGRTQNTHTWEITVEPVLEAWAEFITWNVVGFCYLVGTEGVERRLLGSDVFFEWNGFFKPADPNFPYPPYNESPNETNEWDLFHTDATTQYQMSTDRGAEISLTSVTEQIYGLTISSGYYEYLSTITVHARSGSGLRDLRSVSPWVTRGNWVRPLGLPSTYENANGEAIESAYNAFEGQAPTRSTSYAPEVFVDSVINKQDGIGAYASIYSLDLAGIARAQQFCVTNQLFFDGLIGDAGPWREFWANVASFSLLELARVGGRETLIPAVPYNPSTYAITRDIGNLSGAFGPGNIIEGTLREEHIEYGANVQDVIITLIYRDSEAVDTVFPRNNSVTVKRADTNDLDAIQQTIDVSQFVSSRNQCILLGKYLCNSKRYFRRAIEFTTYPTDTPIFPGAFFVFDSGETEWQQVYTGSVGPSGVLNTPAAPNIPSGTYTVMLYQGGRQTTTLTSISITNNTASALSSYVGAVFVLGVKTSSNSIYRVTEVEMDDDEADGVTIKAMVYPCDVSGSTLLSRVAEFTDALFTVT